MSRPLAVLYAGLLGLAVLLAAVAAAGGQSSKPEIRPQVVEAISLACATYGHCAELWRKARCETGGTFDPHAFNSGSGAAGLFQFLRSTWDSTPYAGFDRGSPYASAMAAGWMHDRSRGGEWACP